MGGFVPHRSPLEEAVDEAIREEINEFLNNVRFQTVEGFHVGTSLGVQLTVEIKEINPDEVLLTLTLFYKGEELDVWSLIYEKHIVVKNIHGATLARIKRGEEFACVGRLAGKWLEFA